MLNLKPDNYMALLYHGYNDGPCDDIIRAFIGPYDIQHRQILYLVSNVLWPPSIDIETHPCSYLEFDVRCLQQESATAERPNEVMHTKFSYLASAVSHLWFRTKTPDGRYILTTELKNVFYSSPSVRQPYVWFTYCKDSLQPLRLVKHNLSGQMIRVFLSVINSPRDIKHSLQSYNLENGQCTLFVNPSHETQSFLHLVIQNDTVQAQRHSRHQHMMVLLTRQTVANGHEYLQLYYNNPDIDAILPYPVSMHKYG
jgi:hypothetical protein